MMNVTYHSSDSFAPVLAVSIMSIIVNNREADGITFYVIENKISTKNKEILVEMVESNGRNIVFIPLPDMQKEFGLNLLLVQKKWVFDSYCRLFLTSILPKSVERVLYLDCDTLCNANLLDYYNMDLDGYCCAGVTDCLSEKYYNFFKMNSTSRYVNSGAILINLKEWYAQGIEQKVVDYVDKKHGYVFFMEQSVLNIVLQDKIKVVHPCYNTFTLMVAFSRKNLYRLRKCKRFYTEHEVCEAVAKPSIIHLTNFFYVKGRPWIEGNEHPYKDLFMKYRELTPWKNKPLFKDCTSTSRKFMINVLHMFPTNIVCLLIGWVYNFWRPMYIAHDAKKKEKLYKEQFGESLKDNV